MPYDYKLFTQCSRTVEVVDPSVPPLRARENVLGYLFTQALEVLDEMPDSGWEYVSHSVTVLDGETMLSLVARRSVPDARGNGARG
jgi:hypothetical protein